MSKALRQLAETVEQETNKNGEVLDKLAATLEQETSKNEKVFNNLAESLDEQTNSINEQTKQQEALSQSLIELGEDLEDLSKTLRGE